MLKKSYFVLDTPNGPSKSFQRHAYQLIDSKAVTLIHYIGNEECVSKFPHRNANTSTPFVRTCPSYLKKCAAECKEKKANVVYKKEISQMTCQPEHVPTHTPRNMKQLRNLRFKHLHQTRISKDELYNLHEIAYDTPGYVHKISTFPDLVCVCGLQEILDEADKVLMLQEEGQLLSYDTTFQLGDFYVSPLLFRHTLFTEKPCVPAMYLIHERKFTETHRVLFQEAVRHIPSLKTTKSCMVTDKERAITKAAELEVPNLKMVQCWNHLFRDIRFWLRKHGAPAADITIYVDDVSQLFHSPSEEAYNQLLEQCCERWDASFEQYYRNEIHPAVPVQIGRWVLEQVHLYNPYCGITNNQSEGLNRVVKDFQSWKEAPLDTVVLALYQLQVYYYNETKRGFAGI